MTVESAQENLDRILDAQIQERIRRCVSSSVLQKKAVGKRHTRAQDLIRHAHTLAQKKGSRRIPPKNRKSA